MNLDLNRKYLLNSIGDSIIEERIKVVGVLNFDEAIKKPYDIMALAISEKVATDSTSGEYLTDKLFYHCVKIEDNSDILIWSEIIDDANTNLLETSYVYESILTVQDSLSIPISTIIYDVNEYVNNKYPGQASLSFEFKYDMDEEDDTTLLEEYANQISDYKAIVDKLLLLKPTLTQIDSIISADISSSMSDINEYYESIKTSLSTISQALSN